MNKDLLHTTEGVRDFCGTEYKDRELTLSKIREEMRLFGYEGVDTPTFEYFDLFAGDLSETSSKELYKFFDKEGDTLVLRSDFTPSIARCTCKYFLEEDAVARICYTGKTFMNTSSLQGKLNEYTQTGAELMNDGSVYADAEMIALLVSCLLSTGLKEFQVSIGDAGYFKGLCTEAGLQKEAAEELRELIAGKNYFAAEKLLQDLNVDSALQSAFLKASSFLQSEEDLAKAVDTTDNKEAKEALRRLLKLHRVLKCYHVDAFVSYDLGMLNRYQYYTGVIFRAYTYGVGDAIASGGRYDMFLSRFGKDAPAIGFVIMFEDLMNALYRQKLMQKTPEDTDSITISAGEFEARLPEILQRRKEGAAVRLQVTV